MLRTLIVMIALLPCAGLAAPRPETGLLAKDTPLPATIPLQIRTNPGSDFAIALTNADNGSAVISGYQHGGDFFRLLVPPGDHAVTIVAGRPDDWQGPRNLFGPDAAQVTLPLTFAITDGSRRQGHQITLKIQGGSLTITGQQDQVICQIAEWQNTRNTTPLRDLEFRPTTRSRFCD